MMYLRAKRVRRAVRRSRSVDVVEARNVRGSRVDAPYMKWPSVVGAER